jgi:hypothetical protein
MNCQEGFFSQTNRTAQRNHKETAMKVMEVMHTLQQLRTRFAQPARGTDITSEEEKQFRAAQSVVDDPAIYRTLTVQEGHMLATLALDLFDAGFVFTNSWEGYQWLPYRMLRNLADIVPGSLQGLHAQFVDRNLGILGTNSLFREADPTTRDQIIAVLESGRASISEAGDLLCALAWIGDETVQHHFQRWDISPPAAVSSWGQGSHLSAWSLFAGWEFTAEGKQRDLYFSGNYDVLPITRASAARLDIPGPLTIATMQEELCGWCGRRLMTLFDIDLRDPRMAFLGIQGERLRIPMCLNCTFQYSFREERVFMDVDWSGMAQWSPINGERPDEVQVYSEGNVNYVPCFPPPAFVLGAARRTPFDRIGAHIGGCPEWPQADPDYPVCPVCQRTMLFLGQHDLGLHELDKIELFGFEGYLYAFVCVQCRKATIGQQH